ISAKEVVVSSCAVLFGISNPTTAGGMVNFEQALEGIGFTSINTFCLMVFCLLYIPCTAALATIKKESGSWKWTFEEAAFQLIVAWIVTFICYHILLSLWG
ncbi:MAG: ferrous iron transport protein B, partial [Acidaminococcus sp.]|nr:ferrous iron transport protein B [Acidaminococcus sp.]